MTTSTIKTALWAVHQLWKYSPVVLVFYLIFVIVDSLGPALMVIAVENLVHEATARESHSQLSGAIVAAGLVFGLNSSVRSVVMTLSQILSRKTRAGMEYEFAKAMSRVPADQLMGDSLTTRARTASEAIATAASFHGTYVINSFRAVATMAFLVLALAPYSVISALVIVLATIPTLIAFTLVAKIEGRTWPLVSHEVKFGNYALNQLVYEKPAFELSALGTGFKLARVVKQRSFKAAQLFVSAMSKSAILIVLGGLFATGLLIFALFTLASDSGLGAGVLAAGVVALISSMSATSDASYTLGSVVSGTPIVDAYRRFTSEFQGEVGEASSSDTDTPRADIRSLHVRSVSYGYPHGATKALDNISLSAEKGQLIGIVGVNGAGKTTLVRIIMGLFKPSTGDVLINGEPINYFDDVSRTNIFGLLSQEFGRYELTVRESLLLGTRRDHVCDSELWDALDAARLRKAVEDLPNKLDSQLGEQFGGVGLSGGQWQRLALARIALRNAPVWILDEPTSAIDAESERAIFDDLASGPTKNDRITIVVSHRAATLRAMDRIYVIEEGQLIQSGTYLELLASPGRFHEIFREEE